MRRGAQRAGRRRAVAYVNARGFVVLDEPHVTVTSTGPDSFGGAVMVNSEPERLSTIAE